MVWIAGAERRSEEMPWHMRNPRTGGWTLSQLVRKIHTTACDGTVNLYCVALNCSLDTGSRLTPLQPQIHAVHDIHIAVLTQASSQTTIPTTSHNSTRPSCNHHRRRPPPVSCIKYLPQARKPQMSTKPSILLSIFPSRYCSQQPGKCWGLTRSRGHSRSATPKRSTAKSKCLYRSMRGENPS